MRRRPRDVQQPMFRPDAAWVARGVRLGLALDTIVPLEQQQGLVYRCAREVRGLTQGDVAGMAGVSKATVQRVEAGTTPPRSSNAAHAIATALGLGPEHDLSLTGREAPA